MTSGMNNADQKLVGYVPLEVLSSRTGLPVNFLRDLSNTDQIPYLNVNGRRKLYNPQSVLEAIRRMEQNKKGESPDE